jgi:alanyl-tRNA synthetase
LKVDAVRFNELMEEQKERARGARSADSPIHAVSFESGLKSAFTGYTALESQSEILEVIPGQTLGSPESDFIVLRETPFYAESGGQVSDSGTIEIPGLGKRSRYVPS